MFKIRPFKRCAQCGETKPATHEFWSRHADKSQYCASRCFRCSMSSPRKQLAPLRERFFANVEKTASCWVWRGYTQRYGRIYIGGGVTKWRHAHRVAWELEHGPIPAGLSVLHKCDNPPCVRPAHLFLGTQADNLRDMFNKGRANHLPPKLSAKQAQYVRDALAAGRTGLALAAELGVSKAVISRIKLRQGCWA